MSAHHVNNIEGLLVTHPHSFTLQIYNILYAPSYIKIVNKLEAF